MTSYKGLVVPFRLNSLIIWITLFSIVKSDCEKTNAHCAICPGQNYTEVPQGFDQGITDLILPYNNITKLTTQSLKRYSNVKNLNLDSNGIRSTHSLKAIHVLKELKRLSLSGNEICIFDFRIFAQNIHLKEIIVNDNRCTFIREKCVLLPKLESLYLRGNNIEQFPSKVMECFPNLRHLDLSNNKLRTLPSNIENILSKIEKISLSNNLLQVKELSPFILSRSDLNNLKETKTVFDPLGDSVMENQSTSIAFDKSNGKDNGTNTNNGSRSGATSVSLVMIIVVVYFRNRQRHLNGE